MMNDKINDYINTHPRQCLLMLVIGIVLLWQSAVAVVAICLYSLIKIYPPLRWWMVLMMGVVLALTALYCVDGHWAQFLGEGFKVNKVFWHYLLTNNLSYAISSIPLNYLIGFPVGIAGVLLTIDLIPDNPYNKEIAALHKGESNSEPEVSEKAITKALNKIQDGDHKGTVLGVSKYTGQYSIIPDHDINQVLLVLGTTGSGKTITLRRFYN